MSDKDYIKELEERLTMMEKIVEGKDNEINLLKKNYAPRRKLGEHLERKAGQSLDADAFLPKISFKFSISQEIIQDVLSMYDDDTAISVLKDVINEATMKSIAEFMDKRKYP